MDIVGLGKRVRIYVGEQDKAPGSHRPLWEDILSLLQKHGAAGATMLRGLAGFGAHSHIHMARLADIIPDLPVLVEWIDSPDRVDRLLPRVTELVSSGMVTLEDIEIVKYTHRMPRPVPPETVGEVMTRDVASVRAETSLADAVRMLVERDYRALPVVDAGNVVIGIITNGDLVQRGGLSARVQLLGALQEPARERELSSAQIGPKMVGDVMTREVVSVQLEEPLDRAAHLMVERRIKRLPVVDREGHLAGVLSRVDVLRTMGEGYSAPEQVDQAASPTARSIGEIMRRDVRLVEAGAPLGDVLDAVTASRMNRVVVVDAQRRVLGIVTDEDLLASLDPGAEKGLLHSLMGRGAPTDLGRALAADVMRTPPTTVTADTPLTAAIRIMLEGRHKALPITDAQGIVVGIVDRSDLLRQAEISFPASGR